MENIGKTVTDGFEKVNDYVRSDRPRSILQKIGVFLVPWTYLPEEAPWPERLRRLGFQTVAMALREDSLLLNDPRLMAAEKLAVVLGTEGDGLSDGTIAACDYTVRIPMTHGVDSLNVAAASAVAFYQLGLMSGGAPT